MSIRREARPAPIIDFIRLPHARADFDHDQDIAWPALGGPGGDAIRGTAL